MVVKNTISIFQKEKKPGFKTFFFFLIKDLLLTNILESYTGTVMKAKEILFQKPRKLLSGLSRHKRNPRTKKYKINFKKPNKQPSHTMLFYLHESKYLLYI